MLSSCLRRTRFQAAWQYARTCNNAARSLHSQSGPPLVQDLAGQLGTTQPCFTLSAQDMRVLSEPKIFYSSLLDMIRHAKKRIFLSSLYIGEHEHELIDTITSALSSNESLTLTFALDLNRTTRPGPDSPIRLLVPLVRAFPDRVRISLYRSPALSGILSRIVPPRFNEGWGTWHAKIYGVDDSVLLSGANLNKSYFTNRQDRYVAFRSHALSNYCAAFIDTVSTFSYHLSAQSQGTDHELLWPHNDHPHRFHTQAATGLRILQSKYKNEPQGSIHPDDILVYPIPQIGQFGIREEEGFLSSLFSTLSKHDDAIVNLTSGYFGLAPQYRQRVLDSSTPVQLLCAAPTANGFLGSRGISGRIPEGYTLLEQRFMAAAKSAGRLGQSGVELREWAREGWTYHAKGIWVQPTPSGSVQTDPILTLLGSTNLSTRSVELDAELSFAVLSASPSVRAQLGAEMRGLWEHAEPWKGQERRVRMGTRAIVGVVGGML